MKKLITYCLLCFAINVTAQQKDFKVGLVLSGGGAKGYAHVGILKEIDKAGIRLDYIGGTSMGAIVGGLYAAGYSAEQIEDLIKKTDFNTLIRDILPRRTAPFFVKEFGEKTAVTFPVTEGNIEFPKAVSKGQSILNLLYELFDHVDHIQDFKDLSVPFFCIATDVENGGQVILDEGSMPLALRSSGSFPTIVNPIALNDKLLIDGGVANNFPVTIMKEKGMDLIIGVDVEGKLGKKEELNSGLEILNQIVNYQMYEKSAEERKKLDIYIKPDIFNYSVVDFQKKDSILKEGYKAAEKFRDVFKSIAAKQGNPVRRKPLFKKSSKKKITNITFAGNKNYTQAYVLGKMRIKKGDSLSTSEITDKIELLSATNNFESIRFKMIPNEDQTHTLHLELHETKNLSSLSLGLHYDLLYKSGILANYTQKHMFIRNDVFSLDAVFGDNLRYELNYFIDNGFNVSFGFKSRYNNFRANSKFPPVVSQSPNLQSINLKYTDVTNQLILQTVFNRKFALGIGIEQKYIFARTETVLTNNNQTVIDDNNYWGTFGYLKLDTYDKGYLPTNGYFADLNFKWYKLSSNQNNFNGFAQAKGTLGFAKTFWDRFTFQLTNEAGFTINSPATDIFDFYLGGYNQNFINTFVSFYGYDFAELANNSFVKSEFNFRYRIGNRHYANFIANYARVEDNVFGDIRLFDDVLKGYAVGYSYDSFLGPVEIKYSWSPQNREGFWLFNLGFWF
ncbi:MAG: patatin [Flavobacteriaceae bacterium]|nr:patatin [Flavobacteriaceae bacterium]|tara:strand:- start:272989 stop:275184 length:2196 start_codon:yes stop_codon:yes gene_type:complete